MLLAPLVPVLDLPPLPVDVAAAAPVDVSLVSRGASASDADSSTPSVSADGRYVSFISSASSLVVPGPGDGREHLYLKDRQTGVVRWIDQAPGGGPASARITGADLSADGRYLAFSAEGSGLVDGVRGAQVYRADLASGAIRHVSHDPSGNDGSLDYGSRLPSISGNGSAIVFASDEPSLDPSIPDLYDGTDQIHRWDEATDTVEMVTVAPGDGSGGNADSTDPSISGDGTTIAFTTSATNLVPGVVLAPRHSGGDPRDVMVLRSGTLRYASTTDGWGGTALLSGASWLRADNALSDNGRDLTFVTDAPVTELDDRITDANGTSDVVWVQSGGDVPGLAVSRTNREGEPNLETCAGASTAASFAGGGDTIVFQSACADLVGTGTPGADHFRWTVATSSTPTLASLTWDGRPSREPFSDFPPEHPASVTPDAATIVWSSRASTIVPDDGNDARDVFALGPGGSTLPEPAVLESDTLRDACGVGAIALEAGFDEGTATVIDPLAELPTTTLTDDASARTVAYDVSGVPTPLQVLLAFDPGEGDAELWGWTFPTGAPPTAALPYPSSSVVRAREVALCFDGAGLPPRPVDDAGLAISGLPTTFGPLANDMGVFDASSLAIVSVDVGTATVRSTPGGPKVSYTAPWGYTGPATIVYSISDGANTVAARIHVTVAAPVPTPLALHLATVGDLLVGSSGSIWASAQNLSGVEQPGSLFSVRALDPVRFTGAIPSDASMACSVSPDGTTVTCASGTELEPSDVTPSVELRADIPEGVQQSCGGRTSICVVTSAWNGFGTPEAESSAVPPAQRDEFPLVGPVLRATVNPIGDFHLDSLNTYQVAVANWSDTVPLTNGRLMLRSGEPDTTFVSASSADANWSCSVDPGDATTVHCTYAATIAPLATSPPVDLTFRMGNGRTDGCGESDGPCTVLEAYWEGVAPNEPTVLVRRRATDLLPGGGPPPDLAVQLTHGRFAQAGFGTAFRVHVANVGEGATTDHPQVAVTLPAGFTASRAGGTDWSCTVSDAVARCTLDAPVPPGSVAPSLSVFAAIDRSASSGEATAHVATAGDAVADNDTASDFVSVTAAIDEDEQPGLLGFSLVGDGGIRPGGRLDLEGIVRNNGDTPTTGPTTVSIFVPDGSPGGQRLGIEASGAGWTCDETTALRGTRELRCTLADGVGSQSNAPTLSVSITAIEVTTGAVVEVPFHVSPGSASERTFKELLVLPPARAALDISLAPIGVLAAGGTVRVPLTVVNTGPGSTVDPLRLTLPAPAGIAGVGVVAVDAPRWTCSVVAGGAECTTADPVGAGLSAPPIAVVLGATSDVPSGTVVVSPAVESTDTTGSIRASTSGLLVVHSTGRGALRITTDPPTLAADTQGHVAFTATITNVTSGMLRHGVTVRVSPPDGTTITGGGNGWTCVPDGSALACATEPTLTRRGGESVAPLPLDLTFPSRASGTTQPVLVSAAAPSGLVGRAHSTAATTSGVIRVAIPVIVAPGPALTVDAGLTPEVLYVGGRATLSVEVRNQGTAPTTAATTVGIVLPVGSQVETSNPTGWDCRTTGQSRDGTAAVVCQYPSTIDVSETPRFTLDLALDQRTPEKIELVTGLLPDGSIPPDESLRAVAGQGAAALVESRTIERAVRVLRADAGPDRTVPDRVTNPDGTQRRNTVRLDGTHSVASTGRVSYTWVQTQGPPVTWAQTSGEVTSAGTGERVPTAPGPRPTLTMPGLTGGEPVVVAFELRVSDENLMVTDTVAITVTPAPDRPPALAPISTDLTDLVAVPAAGAQIHLGTTATDPDGDPVRYRWRTVGADVALARAALSTPGADNEAVLVWPRKAHYLVIEVRASDGRGGTDTEQIRIGAAPQSFAVSVAGPDAAGAREPMSFTATVSPTATAGLQWRWEQASGPPVDQAVLAAAAGPSITVPAPAVATPGSSVVLRAVATRGSGLAAVASSGTASVALAPAPPPTVAIRGPNQIAPGQAGDYSSSVTGVEPFQYHWSQSYGPSIRVPDEKETTSLTPFEDGVVGLTLTVTDAAGQAASTTIAISVGTPLQPRPSTGAQACADPTTLIGAAFGAADSADRVSGTLGPIVFDVGQIQILSACPGSFLDPPSVTFGDASFALANGTFTGTGLGGTISPSELRITSGTFQTPASWRLPTVTITQPIVIDLQAGQPGLTSGELTATGLPFVALPDGVSPPTTTITITPGNLSLAVQVGVLGGVVDFTGAIDTTTGAYSVSASAAGVSLFSPAYPLTLTGAITGTPAGLTSATVSGSVTGVALGAGFQVGRLDITWNDDGLSASGQVIVGDPTKPTVLLDLTGVYEDASNWSFALTAETGQQGWTPVPNLTIDRVGFGGILSRSDGAITFDIGVDVATAWRPTGTDLVTVTGIEAQLANTPVPESCPDEIDEGSVWLRVGGTAVVQLGSQDVSVGLGACVGLGGSSPAPWSAWSTADFGSWRPVSGIDVTVESLGVELVGSGTQVQITAEGVMRALGVTVTARVTRLANGTVVVDGTADLAGAGVGLPEGTTGHILVSSGAADYAIDDLAITKRLTQGITVVAGGQLPQALQDFLTDNLGLPPITSVVFSAQVSGATATLRADVAVAPFNLIGACARTDMQACPATDRGTTIALDGFFISLSLSGSVSFGAQASLYLPPSDYTGSPAVPGSRLDLTAAMSVDVVRQSLGVVLTASGTWNSALGVTGLDLADLSIQGGITFNPPPAPPTPSIGFAATIVHLPTQWEQAVGLDTQSGEELVFALNISRDSPILELQLGQNDDHTVLRPLLAVEPAAADVLEVDYASLVIAPLGGTIGSGAGARTYQPGMSFGFGVTMAGVEVDVAASIDVVTLSISASVEIGPLSIDGINVQGVTGTLAVNPSVGFDLQLDGSAQLLSDGPSLAVGVRVTATTAQLAVHVDALAQSWQVLPNVRLDTLHVIAHATMDDLESLPDLSFGVNQTETGPTATVFGTPLLIQGGASFSGGELEAADLRLASGPFSFAGVGGRSVTIGGPGCDLTSGTADDGACLEVDYDSAADTELSVTVAGGVTVSGITVNVGGTFDDRGVHVVGQVVTPGFGDGQLEVDGRLYYGSNLTDITEVDGSGVAQPVQSGDWKVSATASTGNIAGFTAELWAGAGSIANTTFVRIDGTVTAIGNTIAGHALLSQDASGLSYEFAGDLALVIDGYELASGRVEISDTPITSPSVEVWGTASIPGIGDARLHGAFLPAGNGQPETYDLSVTVNAALLGTTASAVVRLTDQNLSVDVDLTSTVLNVHLAGTVDADTGIVCANADFSLDIVTEVTVTVHYCNGGSNAGVTASLNVADKYTIPSLSLTTPSFTASKSFGPYLKTGSVGVPNVVEFSASFSWSLAVSVTVSTSPSASVAGSGSVSASASYWTLHGPIWDPGFSWRSHSLGDASINVNTNTGTACTTLSAVGYTKTICVSP